MARILIRTLPLAAGNYGGVLQAWAMQEVLRDLGHEVVTDASRADSGRPALRTQAKGWVKHLIILLRVPLIGAKLQTKALHRTAEERGRLVVNAFADRMISQVRLYSVPRHLDAKVLEGVDVLLVGSDQTWRRLYGDVRSYFFDFAEDREVRRISYAASFGVDTIDDYGRTLKSDVARLARRFDAISVREDSGVRICRDDLGVAAEQHVDPTLLVPADRYSEIAGRGVTLPGGLISYVLDGTATARNVVGAASRYSGLNPIPIMPTATEHTRPTVEAWLRALRDAELIVTDSFHGTVFAILNGRPFVALANGERGAARFTSLLSMLGLSGRLVTNAAQVPQALATPIDWDAVNARLTAERERSMAYLQRSLGG